MEHGSMSVVRVAAAGLVVACLVVAPHVEKRLDAQQATAGSAPVVLITAASRGTVAMAAAPVARHERADVTASPAAPDPTLAPARVLVAVVAPSEVATTSPMPSPQPRGETMQDAENAGGRDYLRKMQEAGYPLDLNKDLDTILSLRAVGVTPEYAKAMAATGMGTPTMHDLVSMKAQGITPEYVAQMKAAGLAPADLHELISVRAVGVTPEYAKGMTEAGFAGISTHELVSLKAQGVTPEYVHWIKTTFPNADLHDVRQAAVFHIDQEFVNTAKAHSFNSTDLDKLVKLKMTGLLD